jgi:5-methylcytosine-specific restriction endonuclease McrA
MAQGCLSLNASYEPLTVIPMRRAIVLIQRGVVEVLETDEGRTIRYGKGEMPFPTVIRLKKYVNVPLRHRARVTNTFLFARDNYTCQYCGWVDKHVKNERNGLTRDHVFPKSRGGKDEWTNVVAACGPCNSKKADRTPEEARMTLRRKPAVPHTVHLRWQIRSLTEKQEYYITQFYGEDWILYVDK